SFQTICKKRQYTILGTKSLFNVIQQFIIFMNDSNVSNTDAITEDLILKFLCSYSAYSTRYIATIVSTLRNYLKFNHEEGYIKNDITSCLPKIKIIRGGFIPSTWKQEDVHKLLNTIDRNNPLGKRDYAILLLVTRLGLRVSDIRALKLKNINWVRKTISIIMQKTKQPLELPLLDDIGWALIDYLKNGRPETISNCIFIRHKAPYDAFSDYNCLSRMLGRRMKKAEIDMKGQKCGLHTLRNTLARVMLESGATLPVISETLGHQNINTTSIYLKIDIEGLRNCAIDPEEVFHE
ncbi:integrase family protein, partial [Candidatus Magnetomorum sp. HK-1]